MKILRTISEVKTYRRGLSPQGGMVGLVPTMGALHEGHAKLMDTAGKLSDKVVVSIFVNPTQFGPTEDYSRYPRTEEADLNICAKYGVDAVFLPPVEEIYPVGALPYSLTPPESLEKKLCGLYRENHFAGVCTVVSKLFNIVEPDRAFFGLKDYQQYCIIKNMAEYMSYSIDILGVETVREDGGLALSSRNKYLSAEEKAAALSIYKGFMNAQELYKKGCTNKNQLEEKVHNNIALAGLKPQYVTLLQAHTLSEEIDWAKPVVIAVAAYTPQSNTRLIDNIILGV